MNDESMEKMSKKKKHGLLRFLVIVAAVAILLLIGWLWLKDFSALVPDRDADREAGLTAAEDKLYILLAGSDKNQALDTARADTIILGCVDIDGEGVHLLSIPRDSYVDIPGYGKDKINHAYAYGGLELLAETVSGLLHIPVDHYALVDFAGFEDIIDALGGVEIDVDKRMYYHTYDALIDIQAGLQRLNGEQALQYVRFRSDELGDITRVSRQQNLLKAVYTEFVNNQGYFKLPQLLPAVAKALETDMGYGDLLRLALLIKGMDGGAVTGATLGGDFLTIDGISYWQVDEDAVSRLAAEVFGGE